MREDPTKVRKERKAEEEPHRNFPLFERIKIRRARTRSVTGKYITKKRQLRLGKMRNIFLFILLFASCVRSLYIVPNYGLMEETGKLCPGRDSCQHEFMASEAEKDIDWKKQNCFCDANCAMYGDCCVDAPAYDVEEQSRNHLSFDCVSLKHYGDLYMRHKCSDLWPAGQQLIVEMCEAPGNVRDPAGAMPVTSGQTGITYRNYLCATCNFDSEQVEFWKPRLECPSLTGRSNGLQNKSSSEMADFLRYNERLQSWGFDVATGENNVFHECNIDPVRPENVKVRSCIGRETVASCPDAYVGNATVRALCEAYTAVVFESSGTFRNVHCAMCNGANVTGLNCYDLASFARFNWNQNFNTHAFSVLFDIGGDARDTVGRIGTHCETGELYDPFFKKCRSVICEKDGFVYSDGKCRESTNPTMELAVAESSQPDAAPSTTDQSGVSQAVTDQPVIDNQPDSTISSTDRPDSMISSTDQPDVNSTSEHPTTTEGAEADVEFKSCPKFHLDAEEFQKINDSVVFIASYGLYLSKDEYSISEGQLVICALPHATERGLAKFGHHMGIVTLVFLGISVVCLAIHIAISLIIPELHNLNGKNLMSLSVALFGSYTTFIVSMFFDQPSIGNISCTALAVIMYFFFTSSFFWMLVIAFDVHRTLKLSITRLRLKTGAQWRKFGIYSLVGWVCPLTLVAAVVVIEHMKDSVPVEYRPGFGDSELCWFSQKKALLFYFAVPFAGVMGANVFLFVCSAAIVFDATKKATTMTTTCGPRTNFYLYLRLAVVMGLTWTTGLVAGFADVPAVWYAFVALNTLQGLFIFVSFTCTKKVKEGLREKLEGNLPQSSSFAFKRSTKDSDSAKGSQAMPSPSSEVPDVPSRYRSSGKTMYMVSRQQASSMSQSSFDKRYF